MTGRQNNDQGPLFYEFRLDAAVPDDHLVRKIDAVLDLSCVFAELALGRPSIDPVLMIRTLIIGYVFGCDPSGRVQVNFAYHRFLQARHKTQDPRRFRHFLALHNERFCDSGIFSPGSSSVSSRPVSRRSDDGDRNN